MRPALNLWCQTDEVSGVGLVAQLEVEAGLWGARQAEGVADKAFRDIDGSGKVRSDRQRVDEVEAGAGENARR